MKNLKANGKPGLRSGSAVRRACGLIVKNTFVWGLLVVGGLTASASAQAADQLTLDVSPVSTVLKSGEKQSLWLRVGVTGFELERKTERAPCQHRNCARPVRFHEW